MFLDSDEFVQIVREHPGINTMEVRDIIMERHPDIAARTGNPKQGALQKCRRMLDSLERYGIVRKEEAIVKLPRNGYVYQNRVSTWFLTSER